MEVLEEHFAQNEYLDVKTKEKISAMTGLEELRVYVSDTYNLMKYIHKIIT